MTQSQFHIEPIPNFPIEDISYETAEKLPLLLENYDLLARYHTEALNNSFLLNMGYRALSSYVKRLGMQSSEQIPIDHGAMIYNATHKIIGARPVIINDNRVILNKKTFETGGSGLSLQAYKDSAVDALFHQTPNLAAMTDEASKRYYPGLTHYALIGVALSRQFEISCM